MLESPARRVARGAAVGLGTTALAFGAAIVPLGAAASAAAPGDQVNLVTFNDFHGALSVGKPFACTVTNTMGAHQNSALISAGDSVGGSEFASAVQNDEPTLDFLNALGVQATAVGNHEFDQGQDDLMGRIVPGSEFPTLASNVYKADGTRLLDPYAIVDAGGVKVAVVGAVTTLTPSKVSPVAVEGLEFRDPVDSVNAAVEELKASGEQFDVIVASYHEGAGESAETGAPAAGSRAIFTKIVEQTSPEVDAIFNGDSHQQYAYNAPVGTDGETRPVLQTGSSGSHIGSVVLTLGEDGDWDAVAEDTELVPVATQDGSDDPTAEDLAGCATNPTYIAASAVVTQALADAEVEGARPVGQIAGDLTTAWNSSKATYVDGVWTRTDTAAAKGDDRSRFSASGNMLADSMKWFLEDRGGYEGQEIIGWMNPGGIRAEFWYPSADGEGDGVVTYAEANNVTPFGNTLNSGEVTGEQFTQMLEEQWRISGGKESFLAFGVSENVTYTYDPTREMGDRITAIHINGEPIDLASTYTIVAASFLFEGGDGMTTLAQAQNVRDTGVLDRDALSTYFGENTSEAAPLTPDFSSRQLTVGIQRHAGPTLQLGGFESLSLGAPQITSITIDSPELGTLEAPYELSANGRYLAEFDLPADFCTDGAEPVALNVTTTPDVGTDLTLTVDSSDCGELRFSDVTEDNMFYTEIMWMAERGYATGWEDGTFRPLQSVNRDAMVAFLYRMAGSPEVNHPRTQPFTDVKPGDEHYDAIIWAHQQGVATGWSDGTFRPTQPIARDAMAAFVYRYAGSPEVAQPSEAPFSDVPATSMFAKEIAWMKSEGISTGWPDGTYRPLEKTNRDATAAFLYRLSEQEGITYLSEAD